MSKVVDFLEAPIDVPLQLNTELERSKLVHFSVTRDGLSRIDAAGGALRRRFYTLCSGTGVYMSDRVVLGWSVFLDSTRMVGSES